MTKWNKIINKNMRIQDPRIQKLEFQTQIFFLIHNVHPLYKKEKYLDEQKIAVFKQYLDTKGTELSKTSQEVLQYYALPYIKKPQENPAMQHLFTKEWIDDLVIKLQDLLKDIFNKDQLTIIHDFYVKNQNKGSKLVSNFRPLRLKRPGNKEDFVKFKQRA